MKYKLSTLILMLLVLFACSNTVMEIDKEYKVQLKTEDKITPEAYIIFLSRWHRVLDKIIPRFFTPQTINMLFWEIRLETPSSHILVITLTIKAERK